MALIKCKQCGHYISDKAKKCPKCGYVVDIVTEEQPQFIEEEHFKNPMVIAAVCVVVITFGIGAYFLLKPNAAIPNADGNDRTVTTDTIQVEEVAVDTCSVDSVECDNIDSVASETCDYVEEGASEDCVIDKTASSNDDWSMITPVKLQSDEAYRQFKEEHPSWNSERVRQGSFDSNEPGFRIEYISTYDQSYDGNYQMVGRYHNFWVNVDFDFNAQCVDGVWYVQLGHGSQKSYAILYEGEGGYLYGTWGKNDKRMWISD